MSCRGALGLAALLAMVAVAIAASVSPASAEAYAKRPRCSYKGMMCAYDREWFQGKRRGAGCGTLRAFGGRSSFGDLSGNAAAGVPSQITSIYNGCEFAVLFYDPTGGASTLIGAGQEVGALRYRGVDNRLSVVTRFLP